MFSPSLITLLDLFALFCSLQYQFNSWIAIVPFPRILSLCSHLIGLTVRRQCLVSLNWQNYFKFPLVVPLCTFFYPFEHADGQSVKRISVIELTTVCVPFSVPFVPCVLFCTSFEHAMGQPKDLVSLKRGFGICTLLMGCWCSLHMDWYKHEMLGHKNHKIWAVAVKIHKIDSASQNRLNFSSGEGCEWSGLWQRQSRIVSNWWERCPPGFAPCLSPRQHWESSLCCSFPSDHAAQLLIRCWATLSLRWQNRGYTHIVSQEEKEKKGARLCLSLGLWPLPPLSLLHLSLHASSHSEPLSG